MTSLRDLKVTAHTARATAVKAIDRAADDNPTLSLINETINALIQHRVTPEIRATFNALNGHDLAALILSFEQWKDEDAILEALIQRLDPKPFASAAAPADAPAPKPEPTPAEVNDALQALNQRIHDTDEPDDINPLPAPRKKRMFEMVDSDYEEARAEQDDLMQQFQQIVGGMVSGKDLFKRERPATPKGTARKPAAKPAPVTKKPAKPEPEPPKKPAAPATKKPAAKHPASTPRGPRLDVTPAGTPRVASARKPHRGDPGYVCEKQVTHPVGGWLVEYDRQAGCTLDAESRWIVVHYPSMRQWEFPSNFLAYSAVLDAAADPLNFFKVSADELTPVTA